MQLAEIAAELADKDEENAQAKEEILMMLNMETKNLESQIAKTKKLWFRQLLSGSSNLQSSMQKWQICWNPPLH